MNGPYTYNLGLLFSDVAGRHAAKAALRYPDGSEISYETLDGMSGALARHLIRLDIRQGEVVALFNDKSPQAYAMMIACLKLGVIYVNLDISSPVQRLVRILQTAGPVALFYDAVEEHLAADVQSAVPELRMYSLHSSAVDDALATDDPPALPETMAVHGGTPAYLMFTSGSTGFPKGAVMSHNNVLHFIRWGQSTFSVNSEDIFTNVNPIYFDNSVFDFYTSLFSGATLVPLKGEYLKNSRLLVDAINASGCTIWFSVPSLLVYILATKALTAADFPAIRRIAFGGEGFPKAKLKQLHDLVGGRIILYNVYGPTECTCICSSYVITPTDFDNMGELAPLGFIAPNFGYELLPLEESAEVAGDTGELALIGPCVGLGYYNDPERSARSFIQNKNRKYTERMYRTGDIVQRAENGYLYFRGRVDNQIKHMGYRIELEEVEAAFSSLDYINEVGVIYERLSPELGQIKAYISLNGSAPEKGQISTDVKGKLPPYMVPKIIRVLDVLPKNRNGKIDRKQLSELK